MQDTPATFTVTGVSYNPFTPTVIKDDKGKQNPFVSYLHNAESHININSYCNNKHIFVISKHFQTELMSQEL